MAEITLRHLLGDSYNPQQPDFILDPSYEICWVGGMGAGKTYAGCAAAIRHGIKFPGARILIARFTYDELLRTTKHTFFELVQSKQLEGHFDRPREWVAREGTNYARMKNGSEFIFSNLDKSLGKHKNIEYSFIFIDQLEEIAFATYQLLLLRCRLTAAPDTERHVLSVANDEGDNWIRRRFLTYEPPHGRPGLVAGTTRRLLQGSSLQNPHLDAGYRNVLLSQPPEIQARWVYATMTPGQSRLMPEFRVVEPFEVPAHWPRWVGIDPARSTGVTCAEWVTVNPDTDQWGPVPPNAPHFYQEYWMEGRDAEPHAEEILRLSQPYRMQQRVMDRTAWHQALRSKKFGMLSVAQLYTSAGLLANPSQGDEWTRVMLYVQATRRGLTVSNTCGHLIAQGPDYRVRGQLLGVNESGEDRTLKIISKQKYHSIDAGGYALGVIPTRVSPVDTRLVHAAFEIRDGLDAASRGHWEQVLQGLPLMRGTESVITTGLDEEEFFAEERTGRLERDDDALAY